MTARSATELLVSTSKVESISLAVVIGPIFAAFGVSIDAFCVYIKHIETTCRNFESLSLTLASSMFESNTRARLGLTKTCQGSVAG